MHRFVFLSSLAWAINQQLSDVGCVVVLVLGA